MGANDMEGYIENISEGIGLLTEKQFSSKGFESTYLEFGEKFAEYYKKTSKPGKTESYKVSVQQGPNNLRSLYNGDDQKISEVKLNRLKRRVSRSTNEIPAIESTKLRVSD
jgi:hypothetical protein